MSWYSKNKFQNQKRRLCSTINFHASISSQEKCMPIITILIEASISNYSYLRDRRWLGTACFSKVFAEIIAQ